MNDKTLVERLRDRGVCSIAQNSCRNDYICEEAATRIEALEAALQDVKIEAMREKGSWVHLKRVILLKCKQALAGDTNYG